MTTTSPPPLFPLPLRPLFLPPPCAPLPRRLKDGYLLENCLAILVNLAPQVEHLQPYAAERLVSVLVAASRRWIQGATAAAKTAQAAAAAAAAKATGGAAGNGAGGESGNGGADALVAGGVEEGVGGGGGGFSDVQELCGEVARVLFLFVWTCTRPRRLGSNVELLYALLHEQVRGWMCSVSFSRSCPRAICCRKEVGTSMKQVRAVFGLCFHERFGCPFVQSAHVPFLPARQSFRFLTARSFFAHSSLPPLPPSPHLSIYPSIPLRVGALCVCATTPNPDVSGRDLRPPRARRDRVGGRPPAVARALPGPGAPARRGS